MRIALPFAFSSAKSSIKSEIAKGDKPHLLAEREKRLEDRERELKDVLRMLDE